MTNTSSVGPRISTAAVVLPCTELDPTLSFFTERLGFRLETIFPADDPRVAELVGYGVRVQLEVGDCDGAGLLRLMHAGSRREDERLVAPNGTRIEFVSAEPSDFTGEPEFTLSRMTDASTWITGRAGMRYRDLIPGRQGGRIIASNIAIEAGGPVPDYVHFHRVQFQMIYCTQGWVRVVYEDQGPPMVMRAGDCFLQPPGIRHRVLECSDGLEVVEVTVPADHPTHVEHALELPTDELRPDREYGGQRFVFHQASSAEWSTRADDGFEARDLGLSEATGGLAHAEVLRGTGAKSPALERHAFEMQFVFVLDGEITLSRDDAAPERMCAGDASLLPGSIDFALHDGSAEAEVLMVSLRGA